ncbi:hypothetical protein [Arachidicoccus terrestris]|uniref:hypothetical protein n=1 Tax=Arachidicoccus terrestris TaxID=2875539 RepID=UPI001CC4FBD6|nr:hypothetical protein [Arachidicoccus terrestris]UAY54495.1 hypothetical protein K9M52_13670 [Arachidicoccus terrestris]
MENQEINLEKVHRLIDSLQSQAAEGSTHSMLSTAQLIVAELQYIHANKSNIPHKNGNVSVVMPFSGKPVVSHVPSEERSAAVRAGSPSTLQPPTIITEAKPSEAADNHSFGNIPVPPTEILTPAAEKSLPARNHDPEPVQKELFPLAEEQEEAISPLTATEYPTSVPNNSPDIQQHPEIPPVFTDSSARKSETGEQIVQQPAASIQVPVEQAPDFDQNTPRQVSNPLQITQTEEEKKRHLAFISDNFSTWADYGMAGEAPTLVQNQPLIKDLSSSHNNNYQQQQYRELNEQLGQPQEEWAHKMQSTPIENLSSAIGVNDRYLYISELFRGDESMYERSIITLNKFNNFHEAHAWSERELRLKLGWDTQNPITQQFEQLIKRRFM